MDERALGRLLVILGLAAVVVGALVYSGALSWFGRLPGDIRIEGERTRVFVPITSMLLLSAAISLLLSVLRR
jgi:NAD/NADP transhydrogenase beta subunit